MIISAAAQRTDTVPVRHVLIVYVYVKFGTLYLLCNAGAVTWLSLACH